MDWKQAVRLNIFMLKLVGLWPADDAAARTFDPYTLWTAFTVIVLTCGHNVFQVCNLVASVGDLDRFTATLFVTLTLIMAAVKSFYLLSNMITLKQLVRTMTENLLRPKKERHNAIVESGLRVSVIVADFNWKGMSQTYTLVGCLASLLCSSVPLLDGTHRIFRLPYEAWYPFKVDSSFIYSVLYVHQHVSVTFMTIIIINNDILVSLLNAYVGTKCDILCDDLKLLFQDVKTSSMTFKEGVVQCVKDHKDILSFAENSNRFFDKIIFTQFFTSSVSCGMTMFQLTLVEPFSSQYYSLVIYGCTIVVQTFNYCWFGNEVELKSIKLVNAVFESDWTEAPTDLKKLLIIFMMRVQRPIKMSAFNLFYLTLDTYVRILRTAWSYFAVLRQVNN